MVTILSFLSGWGLLISLIAFVVKSFLQIKKIGTKGFSFSLNPKSLVSYVRKTFVPEDVLQGKWPVKVFINDAIFWLTFIALLLLFFIPGHAAIYGNIFGVSWPAMAFRWADGLSIVLTFGVALFPLRHLLIQDLRVSTTKKEWLIMMLLLAIPFFGLLSRSAISGYSLWLLLHLLSCHTFLWCAPHCRFTHLLR